MLDSILTTPLMISSVLICALLALALGVLAALIYMKSGTYSKGFVITLALLPLLTQAVILVVNGNLGTGVAVMGAFGLIRFRSAQGSAREIGAIFFSMALGLCLGAGYIVVALLVFLLVGGLTLLMYHTNFGTPRNTESELKISIPEDLDYGGLFDDLLNQYTNKWSLERVRTTNMGSLYELSYHVVLKNNPPDKRFLDAIRCRNGNLTVSLGRVSTAHEEL